MKFFALFLLLSAAGLPSLSAKTVTAPDETISLTIPDDWEQADRPGMLIFAQGGPDLLQVVKSPNPHNIEIDSSVVDNIKHGMQARADKAGGTINFGDEGPLNLGGAPAYVIHATQTVGSSSAQISFYVVDANKSLYALNLVTSGPAPDSTLQGVVDSFRFTSPPALPESTFERRAYKLGILTGVLLVLAGVGGGIWFAVRRSRSS
jgi:hypothetical protein